MGRLDAWHRNFAPVREVITEPPSSYAERIFVDSIVYTEQALSLTLSTFGPDNVLFGSDYPHKNGDLTSALARAYVLAPSERSRVLGENAARLFCL
jgi:aminocarboxymuconate-semialdehyde decarboxylase